MTNYEKLFSFTNYFKDEGNLFCYCLSSKESSSECRQRTHLIYENELNDFIDEVYNSGLMRQDYNEYLECKIGKGKDISKFIENSDIETLRAILTYYVRQERFYDGFWGIAAKEGAFLKILERLRGISEA
ncbi:MAG: DUF6508 domain-containing protein [Clostridiaceae bacterium]